MCGIAGKLFFNNKQAVDQADILRMTEALSHRGPDDSGVYIDGPVGLGHRRLSIIDLTKLGHQPMSDVSGKIWIIFNGEIYNFQKLRTDLIKQGVTFRSRTDTEVVISMYIKHGNDCLQYLQGMFAFAIWDKEKNELFIARDRLGKKPLKYFLDDKKIIFASELKAILKNSDVDPEIDYSAINEFLTYQYVPHPRTGFKNIFKLEPGHFLIVKPNGNIIKNKYWSIDYSQKILLSENEWEERIAIEIEESVKKRMIADVPIGAHLSGGIDSGVVTAIMARQSSKPISTFSIGFQSEDYSELKYAKKIADRYGTNHTEIIVNANSVVDLPKLAESYEEPFADSSALPTWYLCRETKKFVTVALNGDGGDENFGGYDRYIAAKLFDFFKIIPSKNFINTAVVYLDQRYGLKSTRTLRRILQNDFDSFISFYFGLISYFTERDKGQLFTDDLKKIMPKGDPKDFFNSYYNLNGSKNRIDNLLFTDINTYLPNDLLVKTDIASMAHALEVRSPLLDTKLLELTAKMPTNLKIKLFNKKYLFKKIAYKLLPKECIERPKMGFAIPHAMWFQNELKDYINNILTDKVLEDFGLDINYIRRLIESHHKKLANHAGKLWVLLMLRYWLNIYFKK